MYEFARLSTFQSKLLLPNYQVKHSFNYWSKYDWHFILNIGLLGTEENSRNVEVYCRELGVEEKEEVA